MDPPVRRHRTRGAHAARPRGRVETAADALLGALEAGGPPTGEPAVAVALDAWLVDATGRPAPRSTDFLVRLDDADVVAGAVQSALVIRVPEQPLAGDGLPRLERALQARWQRCAEVAGAMGLRVVAIGILPTLRDEDLRRSRLCDAARGHALQLQRLHERVAQPLQLDIEGPDGRHLRCEYTDVLPETAAGSCTLRLRLPPRRIAPLHDALLVASAPLVAMSGNAPLLFGQALWQDTRVPLLEQVLGVRGAAAASGGLPLPLSGLGGGYAGASPAGLLRDIADLPGTRPPPGAAAGWLAALRERLDRLWRWSRPTLDIDAEGHARLGLELGLLPSGPGIGDMAALLGAALGVAERWAVGPAAGSGTGEAPGAAARLPFAAVLANLQAAALRGLSARLSWFDGREASAAEAAQELLREARLGLAALGVEPAVASGWIDRLDQRVATHRTGARWQLARLHLRRGDLAAMTLDYVERQAGGEPVHAWT